MSWAPQVPLPLLADPNLSDAEARVLVAVIAHVRPADGRLTCWPSDKRIAEMTGKEERSIQRILAGLDDKGYLKRTTTYDAERGGRKRLVDLTLPYEGWGVLRAELREGTAQDCAEAPRTDDGSHRAELRELRNEGKERREEEKPPTSPPLRGELLDRVDEVLATFNAVAGRPAYRTGPHRSAAISEKIRARLREETAALDGDVEHATRRCCIIVKAHADEWGQDPRMAPFVRPDTLFRPEKWAERVALAMKWWERAGRGREAAAAITPERAADLAAWQDAYSRAHATGMPPADAKIEANRLVPAVARV